MKIRNILYLIIARHIFIVQYHSSLLFFFSSCRTQSIQRTSNHLASNCTLYLYHFMSSAPCGGFRACTHQHRQCLTVPVEYLQNLEDSATPVISTSFRVPCQAAALLHSENRRIATWHGHHSEIALYPLKKMQTILLLGKAKRKIGDITVLSMQWNNFSAQDLKANEAHGYNGVYYRDFQFPL